MHDLGDGCAHFKAVDARGMDCEFRIPLQDFFDWWDSLAGTLDKADPRAGLRAVQKRVLGFHGVTLNLSQCDELVSAAHYELECLAKKRQARLASLHGSALPS